MARLSRHVVSCSAPSTGRRAIDLRAIDRRRRRGCSRSPNSHSQSARGTVCRRLSRSPKGASGRTMASSSSTSNGRSPVLMDRRPARADRRSRPATSAAGHRWTSHRADTGRAQVGQRAHISLRPGTLPIFPHGSSSFSSSLLSMRQDGATTVPCARLRQDTKLRRRSPARHRHMHGFSPLSLGRLSPMRGSSGRISDATP
jgi:hypothetical protein